MTIFIGARDLRQKISEILGKVGFGGDVAVVEKSGKPMAAIIPIEMYQKLVAEREARFQIVDKIRNAQAERPLDEIDKDIAAAIQRARG
jgi:prevent-host-death family protein